MKEKLLFFLAMLICAFQVLISFPINIWLQNQFNFSVQLLDAVSLLVIIFCFASVILFAVAIAVPDKIRNYIFPVFVLASVLLYLQQNVLVWDYGILDGKRFDFQTNSTVGLIDAFFWGIGFLILILWRDQVTKRAETILIFSGLITVLSTVFPVVSFDFSEEQTAGTISDFDKFTFSDQKNIFLFILDGFQSDLFLDFITNEPELKDEFTGFTFYRNSSSVFAKTYPTIPALLTGRTYTKQQPFKKFLSQAYENSLLTSLVDNDWDVGLYPRIKSTIKINDSIMSNYVDKSDRAEKIDSYLQALDLSLFRAVPHFMKSYIYNDGNFISRQTLGAYSDSTRMVSKNRRSNTLPRNYQQDGLNFLDNLGTFGSTGSNRPTFRFYHLNMPHEPFLLNRDLVFGRQVDSFSAYHDYAYATVKLMISYLKEMKRLGIYDNSSILITADHGGGEYINSKYISAENRYVAIDEDGRQKASGKPLVLIKGQHDNTAFKDSAKPVSLLDIAPTIASFAGITGGDYEGRPIEQIKADEPRTRTYYYYSFTGSDSKYMGDFSIYLINGDIYDETAWTMKGKLVAPKFDNDQEKYVLGRTVSYGSDAKSDADYLNAFLKRNDYLYEPSQLISANGQIDISLGLDDSLQADEIYLLELEMGAANEASTVIIEANAIKIPSFVRKNEAGKKFAFLIPGDIKAKDKIDLHFATSGISTDGGPLSISKLNLKLANLSEMGESSVIRFSKNLDGYQLNGFWAAESWGRWTSSPESTLYFLEADDFCRDNYLHIQINKFYRGVSPESFQVYLNDGALPQVGFRKTADRPYYYYSCSEGQLKAVGINTLAITTDKVVSPAALGISADPRSLGVGLVSIEFVDKKEYLNLVKEVN